MKYSKLIYIILIVFPSFAAFAEEEANARVVTYKAKITNCLAPVAIKVIDGRLRQLPATGFDIEPGLHRLAGDATSSLHHCPKVSRRSRKPLTGFPAVEWLFEPGMVYYVALNHGSQHEEEWHLVVWRVENEDGELVFDITRQESTKLQN